MTRRSPANLSPLRKRHPTFERIATSAPTSSSSTIVTTSSINNLQSFDSNSTRENSAELTTEPEIENKSTKIQKFVKILYSRQNSKNLPEEKCSFNTSVLDQALQRLQTGLNPSIIKSMSDCACYKPEKVKTLEDLAVNKNEEDIIEENQATVGHGRGEWAKDIIVGKKMAGKKI